MSYCRVIWEGTHTISMEPLAKYKKELYEKWQV